jgi:hypothetical protein
VPRSINNPLETNRANVDGTLNVLVAARDAKASRVIYAASSSAYGDTPTLPKSEAMPPNAISPYAVSRLAGEYYMTSFWRCYGRRRFACDTSTFLGHDRTHIRRIPVCSRNSSPGALPWSLPQRAKRQHASHAPPVALKPRSDSTRKSAGGNRTKILYFNLEPVRGKCIDIIRQRGHNVAAASSDAHALAIMRRQMFDA